MHSRDTGVLSRFGTWRERCRLDRSHSRRELDHVAKNQFVRNIQPAILSAVTTLLCPHCQTPTSDKAGVCRGCGAEIVRGASRGERLLLGVGFVITAIVLAGVLLRILEIAHGNPPLPPPKPEYGFWVLLAVIAVVVVPYMAGTRVARLFWRSRIRFYRRYQHQ
jgi:hypothetical protein